MHKLLGDRISALQAPQHSQRRALSQQPEVAISIPTFQIYISMRSVSVGAENLHSPKSQQAVDGCRLSTRAVENAMKPTGRAQGLQAAPDGDHISSTHTFLLATAGLRHLKLEFLPLSTVRGFKAKNPNLERTN